VNLSDLPITIISPRARTAVVDVYGFPMECEYEYDEGEAPIFWPTEAAHPGCPPNAELLACRVGGVDIYEMLKPGQIERIEDAILEQLQ
jgi:hypothetical protein